MYDRLNILILLMWYWYLIPYTVLVLYNVPLLCSTFTYMHKPATEFSIEIFTTKLLLSPLAHFCINVGFVLFIYFCSLVAGLLLTHSPTGALLWYCLCVLSSQPLFMNLCPYFPQHCTLLRCNCTVRWAILSRPGFCQEKLDQMILVVPSNLGLYVSTILLSPLLGKH